MRRNERSRLFRTHESSSVHLDHERPLWVGTETPWRSADFYEGVQDLMIEATAKSVTLLTSRARKYPGGVKHRGTCSIRGRGEWAVWAERRGHIK